MNALAIFRGRMKRAALAAAVIAAALLAASFVLTGVACSECARAMSSFDALASYGTAEPFLTATFAEAELAATHSIAFPLLVLGLVSTLVSLICTTLCLVADLLQAHESSDGEK
ncbi:hypothetical protein B5F79_06950 [Olsenella sp. An285]|uniref:hypothetical protein n=1 Tax=Olsenella sp. An285 TaxID=1965621 RepID=UPI000B36E054|nr:hypothetical protein [Olsenella sp. An285]OUO46401.1 hypothetical protein B5F79_06950 [Olsenella sp. An285]